jgi:NADH:ubiquinone oxidoreductase subunit E
MRWIVAVGLLSGLIALICAAVLIGDHLLAIRRAPAEKELIVTLEKEVKSDAAIAPQLEEERKRQTDASLARKARNRYLAWTLLVTAGLCIACGKRYMALRPQRLPSLDDLVAVRFAPTAPAGVKRKGARADRKRQRGGAPAAGPDGLTADAAIDLAFVDDLVTRTGTSREAAIVILQAIQTHYRYLPDEALKRVCELTDITPAQVAGTSSFYAQFRRSPVGRYVVRVCHGTACHVAGIEQIHEELRRHLEIPAGEDTDPRRMFTLDKVACLGCCSLAPVMMIEEETAGHLTPASARQVLDNMTVTT